ncbi:MAG: MoaD/ThiS family protein [Caldilineaceae bacterium]|jgi:molybdopterin synthase sulfur carrier subunit
MQHQIWIPSLHRDLTDGAEIVTVDGETVGDVVAQLDARFPGMAARLCQDGRIRPYIAVSVDNEVTRRGLRQRLTQPSEIHFIPSLSGG